jgi:hypothetical protein
MKCPKCGHENAEDSQFCGVCGASLSETTVNSSVGEEATSRFTNRDQFAADLKTLGFGQISIEDEWKFTHIIASKGRLNPRRPVERLCGL